MTFAVGSLWIILAAETVYNDKTWDQKYQCVEILIQPKIISDGRTDNVVTDQRTPKLDKTQYVRQQECSCKNKYKYYNMKFIFCHYIFFKKVVDEFECTVLY